MNEKEYLIALGAYVPLGPQRINLLTEYFGSAKSVWEADPVSLESVGLTRKLINGFAKHKRLFSGEKYFERLRRSDIKVITINEKSFPESLKEIPSSPLLLYIKGNYKSLDKKTIAIVGTRKMTLYGRQVTRLFAREFSRKGKSVVSGLARGIDTEAHRSAILAKGRTIAVLGCGLDRIYPPENKGLAKKIVDSGGALVSEYPLGYPPLPTNFVARNRIISGLSKGVLVVEGRQRSGTLLTASAAADQGRPVFAVPGQINSPMSEAPLFLIRNGAKLVTKPEDVLEDL